MNFYKPPLSSCTHDFPKPIIHPLNDSETLSLGDIKYHIPLWESKDSEDDKELLITDEITSSTYIPFNS